MTRNAGRAAGGAIVAVAVVVLFWLYWRMARSASEGSDAASIILQGSDMLHGNPLLRGWRTADVSFYSTELVQYMLLQTALPMSPGLVYVAGAMTYAILVVLAGWLAKGRATGREGIVRACVGGGIMLAPALGEFMLVRAPDHLGSAVPVLLAWIVIDRYAPQWWVPAAVCLLLAWGEVGDPLIEITGAAAIALACGVRSCHQLLLRRRDGWWFEPSLAVAAAASAGVAWLATTVIRAAGGFTAFPVKTGFMGVPGIWLHAAGTGKGLLGMFGAAFWDKNAPAWETPFDYAHLAGVALAVAGLALAVRAFFRRDGLLAAGLATGIALNLAAFMTSVYAKDLLSVREASAVLPFAAVLAGRLLPGHLLSPRLRRFRPVPVLAAAGVAYAAMLGVNSAAARPTPPQEENVAGWLADHHFANGLSGGYWLCNIVTVETAGRVKVRNVTVADGAVRQPRLWEIDTRWYSPSASTANFLLTDLSPGSGSWKTWSRAAENTFGRPARTYRFGTYTVFTWNHNVLSHLQPRLPARR